MKPHRPYTLEKYNPEWKEHYAALAEELRPIFGDNLIEIEHIGSTAIEGMLAKPQIDVMITVKNLDAVQALYPALTAAGYTPRGREYVTPDDEYITRDASDGRRLASVHVYQEGNPRIAEKKAFRDYLRENKEDRELYIATKQGLYTSHAENYADYDRGKHDVVAAIMTRATAWAHAQTQSL